MFWGSAAQFFQHQGHRNADILEPHKPLFGVHPLLLLFSHDDNADLLLAGTGFNPNTAVQGHYNTTPVLTSTPKKIFKISNQSIREASLLWTMLSTGKLAVQCQLCGQRANTGSSVKNLGPLQAHLTSQKCRSRWRCYLDMQKSELHVATNACISLFPHTSSNLQNVPPASASCSSLLDTSTLFGETTPSKFQALHKYVTDRWAQIAVFVFNCISSACNISDLDCEGGNSDSSTFQSSHKNMSLPSSAFCPTPTGSSRLSNVRHGVVLGCALDLPQPLGGHRSLGGKVVV